jgi:hypothetical protein
MRRTMIIIPLLRSFLWLTIFPTFFLPFLDGCSNQQADAIAHLVTIELTEIVNKFTQRPITENTITLGW